MAIVVVLILYICGAEFEYKSHKLLHMDAGLRHLGENSVLIS